MQAPVPNSRYPHRRSRIAVLLRKTISSLWPPRYSEVHCDVETREARQEVRRRPQPGLPGSSERLVVAQPRVGVEQVVKIDANQCLRPPEAKDLGQPHVELVHAIAVDIPGQQQVDRRVAVG